MKRNVWIVAMMGMALLAGFALADLDRNDLDGLPTVHVPATRTLTPTPTSGWWEEIATAIVLTPTLSPQVSSTATATGVPSPTPNLYIPTRSVTP